MSTGTMAPRRPGLPTCRGGFAQVLHAEWTKFRTVRGWVIAMVIAALLTVGIALLDHSECGGQLSPDSPVVTGLGCAAPLGPGGEAVTDNFYFVRQPLAGDGSVTARVTSLAGAGQQPWAKAGLIIKASTRPGSAYAAMMVTAGHGVRMQYDYTGDVAGPAGEVSAASPRWLRLTRAGDTITGYESADGTRWTMVGRADLAGLPATAQAGMFVASPAGASSQGSSKSLTGGHAQGGVGQGATARFDRVRLRGQRPGGAWTGSTVGGPAPGSGFHEAGSAMTVTGSGDIAPDVPAAPGAAGGTAVDRTLTGTFGGLIVVIVVATMFMTAEYRRSLIRVTLSASPARGRVLAAKAVVIGLVTFVAGLAGAAAAIPAGAWLLRSNGNFILPIGMLTEVRLVTGTAALLAIAAVLAVALGTILRHAAGAVTGVIVAMVLPYFFAAPFALMPAGAAEWLLRVTPAAAFSIQQSVPQYAQVSADYTPGNGYFPLAPWAGLAVLCGYAAVALAVAALLLRRRDA
jgi:regulation of enolase protein 1 (concanavalin A-like superfamily)/ABC-type transport system involved in multi-copper enzyme maturation permease subunit